MQIHFTQSNVFIAASNRNFFLDRMGMSSEVLTECIGSRLNSDAAADVTAASTGLSSLPSTTTTSSHSNSMSFVAYIFPSFLAVDETFALCDKNNPVWIVNNRISSCQP